MLCEALNFQTRLPIRGFSNGKSLFVIEAIILIGPSVFIRIRKEVSTNYDKWSIHQNHGILCTPVSFNCRMLCPFIKFITDRLNFTRLSIIFFFRIWKMSIAQTPYFTKLLSFVWEKNTVTTVKPSDCHFYHNLLNLKMESISGFWIPFLIYICISGFPTANTFIA